MNSDINTKLFHRKSRSRLALHQPKDYMHDIKERPLKNFHPFCSKYMISQAGAQVLISAAPKIVYSNPDLTKPRLKRTLDKNKSYLLS